jgi:hypothetical protein
MSDPNNDQLVDVLKDISRTCHHGVQLPDFVTSDNIEWLLAEVDSDWKNHFQSIDEALLFYDGTNALSDALITLANELLAESDLYWWASINADEDYQQEVTDNGRHE